MPASQELKVLRFWSASKVCTQQITVKAPIAMTGLEPYMGARDSRIAVLTMVHHSRKMTLRTVLRPNNTQPVS